MHFASVSFPTREISAFWFLSNVTRCDFCLRESERERLMGQLMYTAVIVK